MEKLLYLLMFMFVEDKQLSKVLEVIAIYSLVGWLEITLHG